jgi:hypothetical protein
MSIPKPFLSILTNVTLAFLGSVISYFTDWLMFIPILFGLGIPLVNIDKPIKQKIVRTLIIILASVAIFVAAVLTIIGFEFDKYIFPGLVVGIAGVLMLGINSLLIDSIKLNFKTAGATFLLSGLSVPIWTLFTEHILPSTLHPSELIQQFGVMVLWMTLTTIGISIGIKNRENTTNDG